MFKTLKKCSHLLDLPQNVHTSVTCEMMVFVSLFLLFQKYDGMFKTFKRCSHLLDLSQNMHTSVTCAMMVFVVVSEV